jgi:Rrf2 family protein
VLSMKAKYAIRALGVLAKDEKKMLSIKDIAVDADVPQKFLESILLELKHHGVVDSKRGIFGGYFLAKPAADISVGNIIRYVDGPLAPIRCASVTAYKKCDDCPDEKKCSVHHLMVDVRNAMAEVLDNKSIKDMA